MRITWGGEAKTWRVTVRLSEGQLSFIQGLGLQFDTPGSITSRPAEIVSAAPLPTSFSGFDFEVEAPADARISIEIYSLESPEQRTMRTVPLHQLRNDSIQLVLDAQQNLLLLTRAPGDRIQVNVEREHLVFQPSEVCNLSICPNACPTSSRIMRCTAKVTPARSTSPIIASQSWDVQLDENGSAPAWNWAFAVPAVEGVYDITLELEPRWYQASWNQAKTTRKVQIIVLDPQRVPPPATGQMTQLETHVPNLRQKSSRFLPKLPWTGTASREPAASPNAVWRELDGKGYLELPPGGWYAVPVGVRNAGELHRADIHFHADADFALAAGVWTEPAEPGRLPTIGNDYGMALNRRDLLAAGPTPVKQYCHHIFYWPSGRPAWLVAQNHHPSRSVFIRNIDFLSKSSREAKRIEFDNQVETPPKRQRLAFMEWPVFLDQFDVERPWDSVTGTALNDWLAFYQGGERLIEYLLAHHYDGLIMGVYAEGGALFPSDRLQPTPRWDSGTFFTSGQDPRRKDVLEMLFRMFARAGLTLIPAINFSGPLAKLESQATADSPPPGRLRDDTGHLGSLDGELPWYDPLSRDVQQEILAILDEMAARYAGHSSFGGITLVCRPNSACLLPGRRWGFDESVMQDFRRDVMAAMAETPWSNLNPDSTRESWTSFRCQRLGQWYQQLAHAVQKHRASARFYLAAVDLHAGGDLAQALTPSLHWPTNPVAAIRDMGWEPTTWGEQPVLLRGHSIAPQESLAMHRRDIALRLSASLQEYWNKADLPAELIFQRPQWIPWKGLEQLPFLVSSDPPWRLQQWTLPENLSLQRFATSLALRDSRLIVDGGLALIQGNREKIDGWSKAFAQLPDVPFDTVEPSGRSTGRSPVIVRQKVVNHRWYAYAVNTTPWPVTIRLRWASPISGSAQVVTSAGGVSTSLTSSTLETVDVEPFGLMTLTSTDTTANIVDYEYSFPAIASEQLRRTLHALQAKLFAAGPVQPLDDLEPFAFSRLKGLAPNWRFDSRNAKNIALVEAGSPPVPFIDSEQSIQQVLHLKSSGDIVWIRSPQMAAPETGRLSIVVPLLLDGTSRLPTLRISVESSNSTDNYYRFGVVGGSENTAANQVTDQWRQFVVHFDDIPVQPGSKIQIGFDLMDAGNVWIGDVRLYDRWLDESDTKALAQQLATASALAESHHSLDQARRILESYWPQFLDQWVGVPRTATPKVELGPSPWMAEEASPRRLKRRR